MTTDSSTAPTSFRHLLAATVSAHPERPALRSAPPSSPEPCDAAEWNVLTWRQVGDLVVTAAKWFDARPGLNRVSIVAPAGVSAWIVEAGALVAGVDINPIYEDAMPDEQRSALAAVSPDLIAIGAIDPTVKSRLRAGLAASVDIDELLGELAAQHADSPYRTVHTLAETIRSWSTNDASILLQSTGTTGPPTVIELTDSAMTAATWSLRHELSMAHPRFLAFLPAAHTSHLLINFYAATHFAADVWIGGGVDTIVDDLAVAKPTVVFGAPLLFDSIRDEFRSETAASAAGRFVFSRLERRAATILASGTITRSSASLLGRAVGRFVAKSAGLGSAEELFSGTAPLDPQTHAFFAAMGWYVRNTYGLTECGGAATVSGRDEMLVGELGRLVDGLELRLDDEGQILLRGPANMQGKLGHQPLGRDNWLATGDRGEAIGDSYRFVGRVSDRVDHPSIETTLIELDALATEAAGAGTCVTCRLPDGRIAVVACPAEDGAEPPTESALTAAIRSTGGALDVIDDMHVRREPLSREAGELGATGKVRRWKVAANLPLHA